MGMTIEMVEAWAEEFEELEMDFFDTAWMMN